ncbi:AMP-binding protein [Rathayibacter soli]|uniref:AMP-binding protein n=1 Tax=Rathayibacter soli TaxID=3144168 RepID=UPI0027E4B7C1|nr:AMP-binding protein [Glaciibacter superstes]
MRLSDYLDKGASLGADAPCFTTNGQSLSYADVQQSSVDIAAALRASGVASGDTVAILSANDPVAFATVFGISRVGAVWSPINPRSEASEDRELLDRFDCTTLIYQSSFTELVATILPGLPKITTVVCLDGPTELGVMFADWIAAGRPESARLAGTTAGGASADGATAGQATAGGATAESVRGELVDDLAMIVGTGGTTGKPKGVMLTTRNLETMTAIVLMSYPFRGRPVYLALPPLTHAAGVLCFPILALGGEIVIMPKPDIHEWVDLVERHHVTHAFLPPTLIYMLLADPLLDQRDLSSLQCFWYGAAPMSTARLEEAITRIGPVMAQLFGQTEAPMMISTMAPREHFQADGTLDRGRLASAGHAAPLVTVAVMDESGAILESGERGEIVIRSALVMAGYYKNPDASAEASKFGWHHTGDIGYVDADGYLFIVDRAKDMIITGGFNVYSAEVEQSIMRFPGVRDCAVVGLPDDKWGEQVTAVVQPDADARVDTEQLRLFVRGELGSVKAPKQIEVWANLPRSKVGKVLKSEIKATLLKSR